MLVLLLFLFVAAATAAKEENVLMTEVFEIVVSPPLFNWTFEGNPDQYVYQPSLLNYPDLPSWINYVFSERHHCGFLYGVPPPENGKKVQLGVVALNRRNYETRHEQLTIHISEKLNPAKYEVHMKIDNLNVQDMFDIQKMDDLKDIFRKNLWKESQNDIYVTLLVSAVKLGARKPLNPQEAEGVVLRLGSRSNFSMDLFELEKEVKPLWKMSSCPRDFKRTSVERYFRNASFIMDWCSFRLIGENNSYQTPGIKEKLLNSIENIYEDRWETISREDVPERNYSDEFLVTILVPMFIMVILAFLLSLILCFHHEGISKRMEDASQSEIDQYSTIHKATENLRHLSNNRELNLSPDPTLYSHSPNSTINRGVHCRPSPPPYVRPNKCNKL